MIYVPYADKESASTAVQALLTDKLIACGNVISSASMYVWNGALQNDNEWIAVMKTSLPMVDRVVASISESHPYEVPAILRWEVDANETYAAWVQSQVQVVSDI